MSLAHVSYYIRRQKLISVIASTSLSQFASVAKYGSHFVALTNYLLFLYHGRNTIHLNFH